MNLTHYYSFENDSFTFTRQQASHFAKLVAGDFNPIHDETASRFIVPGDLLFSILLAETGISQKMHVSFSGMVSDNITLRFLQDKKTDVLVMDENNKTYLTCKKEGESLHDKNLANKIAKQYVKFSGMGFPHIMVPLMREAGMMINPSRPLVIYESMALNFSRLDFSEPEVNLISSKMDVEGKRGIVTMAFSFTEQGKQIGEGYKRMVCSNLKPYEDIVMQTIVDNFNNSKTAFLALHSPSETTHIA